MFWPEAVIHANYLRNRVKSRVIKNKTPFEFWNERKQEKDNVKLLRVFGSEVWIRKNEREKIGARASRGIYLGVKPGVKGVKVWDSDQRKIIVATPVDFREENFRRRRLHLLHAPRLCLNEQSQQLSSGCQKMRKLLMKNKRMAT